MNRISKIIMLLAVASAPLWANAEKVDDELNCFAVIAGKNATADGSVLMGHDEDDSGEQMLNIYVKPRDNAKGMNKYIWCEFPGMSVADAFINEHGVAVASDGCPSREDKGELTRGGVLYEVRTLVAQYAKSARHAVKLIGSLIEERGYKGSGRTYVVADPNEGWIVSVVQGKHWVAQRVPDDCVMALPNNYIIDKINLADTANFAGAADVITYAQSRGWYDPAKDGEFSFKKAYCDPKFYYRPSNVIRQRRALEYITGETFTDDPDTFVWAVKPKHKFTPTDVMNILRVHDFAHDHNHPGRICTSVDIASHVFQLRSFMPKEIGCVMWLAVGHPCIEAYLPWYLGMTKAPDGFARFATADEAIEKHFSDAKNKRMKYPDALAWEFADRWVYANADYAVRAPQFQAVNARLETALHNVQASIEAEWLRKYCAGGKVSAALADELNQYTADLYKEYLSYDAWKNDRKMATSQDKKLTTMLVGTYTTDSKSEGVYLCQFDSETGTAKILNSIMVDNPSYLTIAPDAKHFYAVSEGDSESNSAVNVYSLDAKNAKMKLEQRLPSGGVGPCHVTFDGKNLVLANYAGGTVGVKSVGKNGTLGKATNVMSYSGSGPNTDRQQSSHPHFSIVSPNGKDLYVNDLGTDKIHHYKISGNKLKACADIAVKPGYGPRHGVFSPDGRFYYLVCEISGRIVVYSVDNSGEMKQVQDVATVDTDPYGCGDIVMSGDGKWLYASCRVANNCIVSYKIDQTTGLLTRVATTSTATHPRNFVLSPCENWLLVACRDDNYIQVFSRNKATGELILTQHRIEIPKPVCIKFAN